METNITKKYKIKRLTKAQEKKAQKIINLITELKIEGVQTCVASTPQNKLIFYRCPAWLDSMEDIQDLHNDSGDYVFEGKQNSGIIDAVGY